jgi:hypothetical protein
MKDAYWPNQVHPAFAASAQANLLEVRCTGFKNLAGARGTGGVCAAAVCYAAKMKPIRGLGHWELPFLLQLAMVASEDIVGVRHGRETAYREDDSGGA